MVKGWFKIVGNGLIITVAASVWTFVQFELLESVMLNKLYTNVPTDEFGKVNVTKFPLVVVILWVIPLFIL